MCFSLDASCGFTTPFKMKWLVGMRKEPATLGSEGCIDSLTYSPSAIEVVLALAAAPGDRRWVEPEGGPAVPVSSALISVIAVDRQSAHTHQPIVDRKEHDPRLKPLRPPLSPRHSSYDVSIRVVVD